MTERVIQTPKAFAELYNPHRYKVLWGGRGAAKSTAYADALIAQADASPMRILCTREKQNSIKESVHQLLANRITSGGYHDYEILNTEIRHKNGSRFFFMGLWNNIDSIKSIEGVDVCWVEEANAVSEDSWKKLIPTIRKPESEIWASFNPELRSDAAYVRFVENAPDNAYVKKVSWRDNPWFTKEMRSEMEHLKKSDHDEYLHVWEGELRQFADGAIYAKQIREAQEENRITSVPIESALEVHTAWDLGRNDTTAIVFFQTTGREIRVIDCYESRLVEIDHYARVLKDKGYNYGKHYLPHDVEVTELSSRRGSRKNILESAGVTPIQVVPRIQDINTGIEQTRAIFSRCWFDKERCEDLLSALSNYRYRWDEQYNTFRKLPVHDWSSNYADAFRQFAQGYEEAKAPMKKITFSGWAA